MRTILFGSTEQMHIDETFIKTECGCKIFRPDLPVNGGDRLITCEHDRKWKIRGKVQREITLTMTEVVDP